MDVARRKCLETCARDCHELPIEQICEHLIRLDIFDEAIVEKVKASSITPAVRRLQLMKELKCRGNAAFDAFYEVLQVIGESRIAELLEALVTEDVKRRCSNSISSTRMSLRPLAARLNRLPLSSSGPSTSIPYSWQDFLSPLDTEPVGILSNLEVEMIDGDNDHIMDIYERDKELIYPNFSFPKGLCLIINNEHFAKEMPRRIGTHVDRENMKQLFERLGYIVQVENDMSSQEMMMCMSKFAKNTIHQHASSAIVVVLTHGELEHLLGVDEEAIPITSFLEHLNPHNAPFLKGKPKLVFIQACRGERRDHGVNMIDSAETSHVDWPSFRLSQCVRAKDESENRPVELHPISADIFIGYPTPSHYVSWRNSIKGSWYVQAICQVFAKFAREKDLFTLMTMVHQRVAKHVTSSGSGLEYKQMPETVNRLLKLFYFFPGVNRGSSV